MLIADLIAGELFLFLPLGQIVFDLLVIFWFEVLYLFQLLKVFKVHFGFIFKAVDVSKNKVV